MNKRKLLLLAGLVAAIGLSFFTREGFRFVQKKSATPDQATLVSLEWYRHALLAEQMTEGYRVPVAARMYGYLGLAAYEAALPGLDEDFQSLGSVFPGLHLPEADPQAAYILPVLLNACYAAVFEKFFLTAPQPIVNERISLEKKWEKAFTQKTDLAAFQRSKEFGKRVAEAVYEWSVTDSLGNQAYLHIYDRNYSPPEGEGKWAPCTDFPTPAMLPYWGKVRPFLIRTENYLAKPLPEYSLQPNSSFYTQALEIFTLNSPLSAENLWIAEFWADDHPGLTFSPSGRWISIANQIIEMENPSPGKTLETYLKVGFALTDASIACWHSKYHYNLERPESYIRKVFDPDWRPIHHTPPFPAYPSGHSMFGAAVAEVLTQLYGQQFEMEDRSHVNRTEFKGTPRRFHSFYEMAFENAFSRIPLGVHFRMDCDEGLRLGMLIGKKVGSLQLHKNHFMSMKTSFEIVPTN